MTFLTLFFFVKFVVNKFYIAFKLSVVAAILVRSS